MKDMKTLGIIGTNYFGKWDSIRTACRAVIIEDDMILLSYEKNNGLWMLPGGGLENDETERDCCIREVEEETGLIAQLGECVLELDEYYENVKYITYYFPGNIAGKGKAALTEGEQKAGMEPRWIPLSQAFDIFSQHESYRNTDEMKRGLYLREYMALNEINNGKRNW